MIFSLKSGYAVVNEEALVPLPSHMTLGSISVGSRADFDAMNRAITMQPGVGATDLSIMAMSPRNRPALAKRTAKVAAGLRINSSVCKPGTGTGFLPR